MAELAFKTMLIVNPVSGKGRVKGFLLDILALLSANGAPVTVFLTEKHGDATEFSQKYGADFDRIICTGGDGSLNEVINGLMLLPESARPSIGYIPLGTTNDMASTLGIPKEPKNAIENLSAWTDSNQVKYIDIGCLGQLYFGYVAAFGAFTDIPFVTPQNAKNTWGYLAYVVEAIGRLSKITTNHASIKFDGGYIEDDFMLGFVVNSTSVAGIVKLPADDVSLDDGLFEVLLVKQPKNAAELSACVSDILKQNFNTEHVTLLHTNKISFQFDSQVQWTCDGENGGTYSYVEVKNYHKAIGIFV